MSFLLNHNYRFYIDVIGQGGGTLSLWIAKGITSVDPDNNEESEQTYYYDGGGAAESDVIGFMMSYAFEGHRNYGDPAQDYIMALANKTGPDRKVPLRVVEPNGDTWSGPATITDIKLPGGDANAKGDISFTISFDGQPEFIEASKDFPPLSAPTSLVSSAIVADGFKVAWNFTPPVGTTEAVAFDVILDDTLQGLSLDAKEHTFTALAADTTYKVEVIAKYKNSATTVSPKSVPLTVKTIT